MVSKIPRNLQISAIVRLPHSWSGDTQVQETFLAPSVDKKTRNYDTVTLSGQTTISLYQYQGQEIEP